MFGNFDLPNPGGSLGRDVQDLLAKVGLADLESTILRIAAETYTDPTNANLSLTVIDATIPGLGLHNVNERAENGALSGVYQSEDRPIFRGIQYVGMHLSFNNLEWLTRNIVTSSCHHVESSLKRRLSVTGDYSVGMILKRHGRGLEVDLVDTLWRLNATIYNNAKHTIEIVSLDNHMFSVADAIAVYLICRTIGARLLEDSGITTKYGNKVF